MTLKWAIETPARNPRVIVLFILFTLIFFYIEYRVLVLRSNEYIFNWVFSLSRSDRAGAKAKG